MELQANDPKVVVNLDPMGMVGRTHVVTTRHCYILIIYAVSRMVSEIVKFSEILSLWELLILVRNGLFGSQGLIDIGDRLNIGPHGLDWQDFNTVQLSNPLSLQGHINQVL